MAGKQEVTAPMASPVYCSLTRSYHDSVQNSLIVSSSPALYNMVAGSMNISWVGGCWLLRHPARGWEAAAR